MEISEIFFYVFAGAAIFFSLLVVFNKNAISSAFSLVLAFFSFAGIYALLDAHLVAALQILVYAGAIMVLFVFVIMLLGADLPSSDMSRTSLLAKGLGVLMGISLLGLFIWAFRNTAKLGVAGLFTPEAVELAGGNTRVVSELMFSEYILPFELTSVLLLAAIVGAVAIAKRKTSGGAPHASR